MTAKSLIRVVSQALLLPATLLLAALLADEAAGVQDIMLQTLNGNVATGSVNDQSGIGTLGKRVFGGEFLVVSGNFRAANPGFYSLRTGDALMPAGASGFPSEHNVNFDLLPMSIGPVASNLFYWNGSDANRGGVDVSDVNFVVQPGVFWDVFGFNFATTTTAAGTNQLVTGGLIQETSEDQWADGIDSGTLHSHLALQVRDSDGISSTTAPAGIYMISWQVRSAGFETSDPFFLVFRTPAPTISDAVRNVAVSWVEQNIEMLTSPPGIPGDYNGDGGVDAADYVAWRKGGPLLNDVHDPETVSIEDYTEWRERFGESGGGGEGGANGNLMVPEPATWCLLLSAVAAATIPRRRSSSHQVLARNFARNGYTQRDHMRFCHESR